MAGALIGKRAASSVVLRAVCESSASICRRGRDASAEKVRSRSIN
ncbi:MAG: hypothetical protein K0R40_2030 [Burkholderiales bacterium]|nr:hypothetical protein [Burkholderiales bacterium]